MAVKYEMESHEFSVFLKEEIIDKTLAQGLTLEDCKVRLFHM